MTRARDALVALALVAVAGCGGSDDASDLPSTPLSTVASTTTAASTTVASTTTVAATTTAPSSTTAAPTTTRAETTVPTTVAPDEGVPATVWFGTLLLGYFDGDTFIGNPGLAAAPDGLVGSAIDLRDPSGNVITATVIEGCNEVEVQFDTEQEFTLWYSPDAPLALAGIDTADGEQEMLADLVALGIDPAQAVSFGNDFTADGSADRLVLVDGWDPAFQWPTWIATWSADTREFTTVEGDLDPSNALDIGLPLQPWLDTDRDGNLEVAFAVGDAYLLHELGTGDNISVGAAVGC